MLDSTFPMRVLSLLFVLFLWSVGLAPAYAADGTRSSDSPLGLVVFGDGGISAEEVRSALSAQLGRDVVLIAEGAPAPRTGGSRVTVSLRRGELAVAYDEEGRGTVSRILPARATARENTNDAAALAASLVRNEADDLLGKAPAPSAAASPPTALAPPPPAPVTGAPAPDDYVFAYASFVHPLATNFDRPYVRTRLGLNLVYGRAGELDGGFQLGTINTVVGKEGAASGRMAGVQLAPLGLNYASGVSSGLQVAMASNIAGDDLEGGQLSLAANVAAGHVRGAQVAAVNVAGDLDGAQIGLINVAKNVGGLMFGVVNVADDVDGVPIGLISVTKTGGVHPVVWGSTTTMGNVGLKFATKYTYTMVAAQATYVPSARYEPSGSRPALNLPGRDFFGGGFYIGGHVPLGRAFVDFDLGISGMVSSLSTPILRADGTTHSTHEVLPSTGLRVMGGYALLNHLSLFAGVGAAVRARIVNGGDDSVIAVRPELFAGVQF